MVSDLKSSKKRRMDLTKLPPELSELIASKLPSKHPWLLFPFNTNKGTDCCYFDFSTFNFHRLNLTKSRKTRCCGSSQGWLVLVEECNPSITLLNPLTKEKIPLPPVTTFPNVLRFNRSKLGEEYLLKSSLDPTEFTTLSRKEMRDNFIKKVILSTDPNLQNDYIVLVILNDKGDLAFNKKGVKKWSIIEEAGYSYEDAIYYHGSFYAMREEGSIAICDLRSDHPIVTFITPKITLSRVASHSEVGGYLVDSFGELLLVSKHIELGTRDSDCQCGSDSDCKCDSVRDTVDFKVYKFDQSKPKPKWVKTDTIGGGMLFLGRSSSICLSASGCDRNSIYFSSDNHDDLVHEYHNCGISHLDDEYNEPLALPFDDIISRHIMYTPMWITPSPF